MTILVLFGALSMLAGALNWPFASDTAHSRALGVCVGFGLVSAGAAFAVNVIPTLPS